MDIFEEFWLFVRKYLFSILLILSGLAFLIMGISSDPEVNNLSQTTYFTLGAIVLFLLGFISLYFILNTKLSKAITVIASFVFLLGSTGFIFLNIKTVSKTIKIQNDIEESIKLAKQGLADIKELQEAYEKKNKSYATSFDELLRFAKYDSIRVLVKAAGDLPERKMTPQEARAIGYRYPQPWKESDILKLKKLGMMTDHEFIRDYKKVPVAENIFGEVKTRDIREYDFDLEKLTQMRTLDNKGKDFVLYTGKEDTNTTVLIQAMPPYGPQEDYNVKDTFQIGNLQEKSMKSNWDRK